ncbi:MAG: alpha/beta hydrolase family protein [Candidatus Thorarchaeota archaeon]
MVFLKNLRYDRKKFSLFICVFILCIGIIPLIILTYIPEFKNLYTIEPLALESEDGIYISAFKYTPKGEKSHGGVVVGHGFFGSKLNMQPLSIELVKRGFTVINIDFRGHGASGGSFYRSKLILDMLAAVDYLEHDLPYITEIGLVGHSLGAYVAIDLSDRYPDRINATIAIGAVTSNVMNISNFLIATGRYDPGLTEEKILEILSLYTKRENVKIGELYYGDFNDGNNTKGFISPFAGHLTEIVDYSIIYQTVQWFEQAFHGKKGSNIFITATALQIFGYISLTAVIALNSILVVYISIFIFKRKEILPEKDVLEDLGKATIKKLILYYTIPVEFIQITFFLSLSHFSTESFAFSTTSITLVLIIGAALGSFIIFTFLLLNWEEKFSFKHLLIKIKRMCSIKPVSSIIFGVLTALLSILSIAAIWQWSVQNTLPTLRGVGRMVLITLISFPFFLIREFYIRNVQGQLPSLMKYEEYIMMLGIGIFMDNFLIILIIIVGKLNLAYLPPYALYLLAWVIFSIIQNSTVTWIYIHSGRNILGSTMFISIFYSWMLVVFFPYYGFL